MGENVHDYEALCDSDEEEDDDDDDDDLSTTSSRCRRYKSLFFVAHNFAKKVRVFTLRQDFKASLISVDESKSLLFWAP